MNFENLEQELIGSFHSIESKYAGVPGALKLCKRLHVPGQGGTTADQAKTILVRASKEAMDKLVWPIFMDLTAELHARFTAVTTALLPAIAAGPFSMTVLDHDHSSGQLCESCRKRLLEETGSRS